MYLANTLLILSVVMPDVPVSATVKEFMRISGLGLTLVYKMMNDGRLQSFNIGKRRLILLKSYFDLIERTSHKPVEQPLITPPPHDSAARRARAEAALPRRRGRPPGSGRIGAGAGR
jgi:hypothetical protein